MISHVSRVQGSVTRLRWLDPGEDLYELRYDINWRAPVPDGLWVTRVLLTYLLTYSVVTPTPPFQYSSITLFYDFVRWSLRKDSWTIRLFSPFTLQQEFRYPPISLTYLFTSLDTKPFYGPHQSSMSSKDGPVSSFPHTSPHPSPPRPFLGVPDLSRRTKVAKGLFVCI